MSDVCVRGVAGIYREDREHHVIVVNEEKQLFLAQWELSCHAQDEVLYFRLQGGQALIHLEWNPDTHITSYLHRIRVHC